MRNKCFLTFLFPFPAQIPPSKIFYSLAQSVCRIDYLICQLPHSRIIEISFQVGDMEEMNWIPPSCCQASVLALYLLSVSGRVGFICEIDITIK